PASRARHLSSTSSLSRASISAFLIAGLSRALCTASSTTGPSSTRASARSTASLSTAETIASSAAISTALSIPVARPTAPAPRAPAPSSRAASGVLSSAMGRVYPCVRSYPRYAPESAKALGGEVLQQAVEELALGGQQLAPRRLEVEPVGPVDLGELGLA